MTERLSEQIRHIAETHNQAEYLKKLDQEACLTRDENPQTHFCVYFAGYDPNAREVFFGHHKKSGLWLFNGGHIDEGETLEDSLVREIKEEWGIVHNPNTAVAPDLLTITEINNPEKQTCTKHYDIWYFIPLNKDDFTPDPELLDKEFHEAVWHTVEQAREKTTDPSTQIALSKFEEIFS